jgi:hypothetical protein
MTSKPTHASPPESASDLKYDIEFLLRRGLASRDELKRERQMPIIDLDVLADKIAERLRAPETKAIWDRQDIADYTGYAYSMVRDKLVHQPDFPAAINIREGKRKMDPRWFSKDVIKWLRKKKG